MNPLEIILEILRAGSRVGLGIALASIILFIVHKSIAHNLNPVVENTYEVILLLGVVGISVAAIDAATLCVKHLSKKIGEKRQKHRDQNIRTETAVKNLQHMNRDFWFILLYLKRNNQKRLRARSDVLVLIQMQQDCLLDYDIGPRSEWAVYMWYVVPDVVWEAMDNLSDEFLQMKIPSTLPWEVTDPSTRWMRR